MECSGRRARQSVLTCPAGAVPTWSWVEDALGVDWWGRRLRRLFRSCLLVAQVDGCDTAGATEVGNTEAKENRAVSGQVVAGSEPEGVIVKLEATRFMSSPRERARGMMGKLEQSLCESSGPPTLRRWASPGAENSTFENTSPTVEKALMLKSPPMKSTSCRTTWAWRRCKRDIAALLFLATLLWMWTERNVTVEESTPDGGRSMPRTTRAVSLHVSLPWRIQ